MAKEKIATEEIYVELLKEGADTWKGTQRVKKDEQVYLVLPSDEYDPEDEIWEFIPGTTVRCELEEANSGDLILVAKSEVGNSSKSSSNST